MNTYLDKELLRRHALGNIRDLPSSKDLIDFSSNDYLGEARSQSLKSAVLQEISLHESRLTGIGSTGSRLLTGNSSYIMNLEKKIADFHGFEAGLIFNCGYMANAGLLSIIGSSEDTIFFDAKVHASTKNGIALSQAKAYAFKHNDLLHLENRLKNTSTGFLKGNKYIVIESIYSTDGAKAPLFEICNLAKQYDAHLIVDEAHAIGVFGPSGKGLVAEENLTSEVFALVATFGKALGAFGAIVLGSEKLKKGLINFATSFIYTTAMPYFNLAVINCCYDSFPKRETERAHLHKLIRNFRDGLLSSTKTYIPSATHIQSVKFKGNEEAKFASKMLSEKGFDVRALLSPTVQRSQESLRICLHAFNTENEVSTLLQNIRNWA